MGKTIAAILAGGRGERMDILCHVRPKPALPFAGKFRVIDFTLSNCIYSRIDDILVLTDYQRSYMASYLKQWHLKNADFLNFQVLPPKIGSYSGTADAVYQNLDCLDKSEADTVLVLAGDHVYKLDYRKMLAFHHGVNADVTVGVLPVPFEEVHRFGTVITGTDGRILDFVEKSASSQSNLASMGIYVFNKKAVAEWLMEDAGIASSRHDFGYSILPKMVKQDRVFAYRFEGYWQDIGTIGAYYEANMELTQEHPLFSLDGSSPVLTEEAGLSPSCVGKHASIKNSLVSPGCVIKGRVENSILSPRVWVDEDAVVRNSVVMGNTFIGYHSIIDHSVLDEGVNVGKYCYIGFGSSLVPGNWDITVLGKGAVVPPNTAIGKSCKILPHVGASDFASTVFPAGTVVSKKAAVVNS